MGILKGPRSHDTAGFLQFWKQSFKNHLSIFRVAFRDESFFIKNKLATQMFDCLFFKIFVALSIFLTFDYSEIVQLDRIVLTTVRAFDLAEEIFLISIEIIGNFWFL